MLLLLLIQKPLNLLDRAKSLQNHAEAVLRGVVLLQLVDGHWVLQRVLQQRSYKRQRPPHPRLRVHVGQAPARDEHGRDGAHAGVGGGVAQQQEARAHRLLAAQRAVQARAGHAGEQQLPEQEVAVDVGEVEHLRGGAVGLDELARRVAEERDLPGEEQLLLEKVGRRTRRSVIIIIMSVLRRRRSRSPRDGDLIVIVLVVVFFNLNDLADSFQWIELFWFCQAHFVC